MLWQIQGSPPKKEEKFEEERVRQPSCSHAYARSHQQPRHAAAFFVNVLFFVNVWFRK